MMLFISCWHLCLCLSDSLGLRRLQGRVRIHSQWQNSCRRCLLHPDKAPGQSRWGGVREVATPAGVQTTWKSFPKLWISKDFLHSCGLNCSISNVRRSRNLGCPTFPLWMRLNRYVPSFSCPSKKIRDVCSLLAFTLQVDTQPTCGQCKKEMLLVMESIPNCLPFLNGSNTLR